MSGAKKLIPLLDRILVEKIVAPTKSIGGVLLPDSAAAKTNHGTVVAVGPGRRSTTGDLIPTSVSEGDKVLLPDFGGIKIESSDKELFLYRDEELLAVLKD